VLYRFAAISPVQDSIAWLRAGDLPIVMFYEKTIGHQRSALC
jgi:hypothetical protein